MTNYENLDFEKQKRLDTLLSINEPLFLAYSLKEQFRLFWSKNTKDEAEEFFIQWGLDALMTDLKPFKKLVKTMNQYREGLLNYFIHRITNSSAEGINNKIKTLKRQAYGFRDIKYFELRLYHLHKSRYSFVG